MKAFKIKKRQQRIQTYIADEPRVRLTPPRLPLRFFSKVKKPGILPGRKFTLSYQGEFPALLPVQQERRA